MHEEVVGLGDVNVLLGYGAPAATGMAGLRAGARVRARAGVRIRV
jgi:hypothetical protein